MDEIVHNELQLWYIFTHLSKLFDMEPTHIHLLTNHIPILGSPVTPYVSGRGGGIVKPMEGQHGSMSAC